MSGFVGDMFDFARRGDIGLPIGEALPPTCYIDEDFLAREFCEIFRPNWCGAGRGDRVAEDNRG